MWFLPKDYVWVDTRIDKAHEKHKEQLSIETEFDIKDKTVIFTARVKIWATEQVFTWHSFWEAWKEKAFEKLETVAVWRALAFAWFETRSGIASREEIEVWEERKETPTKSVSTPSWSSTVAWFNKPQLEECIEADNAYSKEAIEQWATDNGYKLSWPSRAMIEKYLTTRNL